MIDFDQQTIFPVARIIFIKFELLLQVLMEF